MVRPRGRLVRLWSSGARYYKKFRRALRARVGPLRLYAHENGEKCGHQPKPRSWCEGSLRISSAVVWMVTSTYACRFSKVPMNGRPWNRA